MSPRMQLQFLRAIRDLTNNVVNRYVTIDAIAEHLGIELEEAIVLAGDCAKAGYVRLDVKGPPYRALPGSAILTEAGRQALKRK